MKKVLIMEDELNIRSFVVINLKRAGYTTIEAGTGVGKSVAYLLPLAEYAKLNKVTCGVASKTNALTDQLVSHELPALAEVLPGGLSYACLKGYDHYPCLYRLNRSVDAELPLDDVASNGRSRNTMASDMLTAIAVTYAYACQSVEGDVDALGIRWGSVPRSLLTVTHKECKRRECPFYPNLCMLHGARRRAAAADIVVTNAKSAAACLYGLPEAPLEDISIVNTQIHLTEDAPSFPVMNAVQQPVTLAGLTAEHVRGLHLTDLRIVGAREDEITLRDVE